jgi:catechol 2,3-dioxygenase-like lactoylglutathione lyase family enzyme
MQYEDSYPVVFVKDLHATATFYTRTLSLDVLFKSDFFLLLALPGRDAGAIAFVIEEHPTTPPNGSAITSGSSSFVTLQVADAAGAFDEIAAAGGPHRVPVIRRAVGATTLRRPRSERAEHRRGRTERARPELLARHGVDG